MLGNRRVLGVFELLEFMEDVIEVYSWFFFIG